MILAVTAWDGRIAPVFDVTRQATLLTLAGGVEGVPRRELTLSDHPATKVAQLAEAGVETLLCGAISRPVADLLDARGIAVIPFLAGELEAILDAYRDGRLSLPTFAMPGCCRRRQGAGRGPRGCARGLGGGRGPGQGRGQGRGRR